MRGSVIVTTHVSLLGEKNHAIQMLNAAGSDSDGTNLTTDIPGESEP